MNKIWSTCKKHPYITVFLVSFLPRLIFALQSETMSISGDEIFSFWPAAKLAGYDWSGVMEKYRYYGFGYTVLLYPFFALIKNPVILYKFLTVLMALFQSLCAPICCHLLRRFFHVRNTWFLILASTACAYMIPIRAVYTYPEFLYDLLVWIVVWILLKLNTISDKKQSVWLTVILWITAGYACTVHTRGVTMIAAILATAAIYQIIQKKNLLNWPVTIALAALSLLGYKYGISVLMQFLGIGHSVGNTSVPVSTSFLHQFLSEPKTWTAFLTIIVGQLNEAIMMSLGLAVPVIWAFFKTAFGKTEKSSEQSAAITAGWFCIIAILITIGGQALSQSGVVYEAMFNGGDWDAFRTVTYGRYFAAYASPLLMTGLYLLKDKKLRKTIVIPSLVTSAILQGYFVFNIIPFINHFNGSVWSYAPFFLTRGFQDNISTAAYLAGTIIVFGLQVLYVLLSEKNRQRWILPVVCMGLIYVYGYNCLYHEGFRAKQNREATEAGIEYLQTLPEDTNIYVEDVPAGSAGQGIAWLYQFGLPDHQITTFTEIPQQLKSLVITSDPDNDALVENGFQMLEVSPGWFAYYRTGENS